MDALEIFFTIFFIIIIFTCFFTNFYRDRGELYIYTLDNEVLEEIQRRNNENANPSETTEIPPAYSQENKNTNDDPPPTYPSYIGSV